MPTLLQINSVAKTGSTGHIVDLISKAAKDAGWKSFIAYGRNFTCDKNNEYCQIGNKLSIVLNTLATRFLDNEGLNARTQTKRLIHTINILKPDIVQLHNIHGYYLNYPLIFSYLAKQQIPIVWTLHDGWSMTGHCPIIGMECDKWLYGCKKCQYKSHYPTSWLLSRSEYNYAQKKYYFNLPKNVTIITVSEWLGTLAQKSLLNNNNIITIHNGVNTEVFKPSNDKTAINIRKELGITQPFIVLGVASNWLLTKGLEDFIKLRNLLPLEVYAIVLIGNMSKKTATHLPKGIYNVSHTDSQKKLAEFYSTASVFVSPTVRDNFPTVNIESLACGTPVITYKSGGSHEAISSDTGIVVATHNINELKEAVIKIATTGKSEYTQACRLRAKMLFNQETVYKKYIELYNEIINKK